MIIIKYSENGKNIEINGEFLTEAEARDFVLKKLNANPDEVWFEEALHEEDIPFDLNEIENKWIWLYSSKKEEFFPYGIIRTISESLVSIQTKNNQEQFEFFRIEKIKDLINSERGKINKDGKFVDKISEYI